MTTTTHYAKFAADCDRLAQTALDPDTAKGREVAARLSVTFAEVRAAITARKAQAAATRTSP